MSTSAQIAQQMSQLDSSYDPTQVYNQVTQQLGIPDARTRVTGLQTAIANSENAIKAVDPSVTGRTQNSLVTEAQRQRLVNMEKSPLTDQYNTETSNYNTENTNLNQLLSQADQQASLAKDSYTQKRQSLADQLTYAQQQEDAARQAATSKSSGSKSSGGSSGATVNPSKDFLSYISNQFKATGKNPSRQTQDAWANAWFKQNGVPANARQVYWNLFNSTYKRTDDPTKDHLYAR